MANPTPVPRGPAFPPERFELIEADPTAHLTDEQKTWRVVKLKDSTPPERVESVEPTDAGDAGRPVRN